MLVQNILAQDVLCVLQPLWAGKTETASRLQGRIETVLTWATVAGHRTGDNRARWAGNLKGLLPAPSKVAKEANQPALQIVDALRWFKTLRRLEGFGSRALEFLALTATRSQEIRGALWEEIDLDAAPWIIPAVRMKMDREHRIPRSDEALALLRSLPWLQDNPLIFPARHGDELANLKLSTAMRRMQGADVASGGAGSVDRASKRLPCQMACAARFATGWQYTPTTPARWLKLRWRIGTALLQNSDCGRFTL